jgi:hypothetical protein
MLYTHDYYTAVCHDCYKYQTSSVGVSIGIVGQATFTHSSFRHFISADNILDVHIESRYSHSAVAYSADSGEAVYSYSRAPVIRKIAHACGDMP